MSKDFFQIENSVPKKKVDLNDYDYSFDIRSRALMAELDEFELEVLQEVVDSSLTFSVNKLSDLLGVAPKEIIPSLEKFSDLQLLQRRDADVIVNKDKRRHIELELVKFEEGFSPDISYVFSLLKNKVPLHVIPNWYAISKTADDMFFSIVEKYFVTPDTYKKYLSELFFDNSAMDFIVSEIRANPDCRILACDIMANYDLTLQQFQEMMLLLEFSFVGFLCYEFNGKSWDGFIRPFHEWQSFYRLSQKNFPSGLDSSSVRARSHEFPFLRDMSALLQAALKSPVKLDGTTFETLSGSLPGLADRPDDLQAYFQDVIDKCLVMKLGSVMNNDFTAAETALSWIRLVPQDQAVMLYRHPDNLMKGASANPDLYTINHIRAAEKTIKEVAECGWVLFEDFIESATRPVIQECGITLTRKGCKWRYSFPSYAEEERKLIYDTIFERLFQCGIVDIGTFEGKPCFKVTPFGKSTLF